MALSGAAVVILDRRQVMLARRIAVSLPGAAVHGPASLEGIADVGYERLGPHLSALFRAGTPIVGICAAGILIRLLAPHLADKGAEPPVIAVSEDGLSVVPLLGGHHGANRLARTIAAALGAHAAITTAGDAALGFALDALPAGWRLGEGAEVKAVTAALLAGEPVRLQAEAASADWLTAGGAPFGDWGRLTVRITDRSVVPGDDVAEATLHPAVLALGLGCERGCAPNELILLAKRVLVAERARARVGGLRRLSRPESGRAGGGRCRGVAGRAAPPLRRRDPGARDPEAYGAVRGRVPRGRLPWRGGGGGARLRRR